MSCCSDRVTLEERTISARPAAFLYALGIFVFLCLFPAIPAAQQDGQAKKGLATVRIRGTEYRAEVARTPDQQMRGLMGRSSLDKKGGMIFLFERAEIQHFWMKNTLIPLDIIFITKEMRIDSIRTMAPCRADPCPVYSSAGKVTYALEVNAGEAEKRGFRPGDPVVITFDK
jgi:uncharacterized membrane protein (UPF0127 family)